MGHTLKNNFITLYFHVFSNILAILEMADSIIHHINPNYANSQLNNYTTQQLNPSTTLRNKISLSPNQSLDYAQEQYQSLDYAQEQNRKFNNSTTQQLNNSTTI
jgi:hypothetical protein